MRQTSDPDARFSPLEALGSAERWLDDHGKGAWIAAIVLAFIAFWPLGLGLLLYATLIRKKLVRDRYGDELPELRRLRYRGAHSPEARPAAPEAPPGDEQAQFESFRARLNSQASGEDFDAYLDRHAPRTAAPETVEPEAEEPPPPPPAPFSAAGPQVLEDPTQRRAPARR